jgi:hypothetical protein
MSAAVELEATNRSSAPKLAPGDLGLPRSDRNVESSESTFTPAWYQGTNTK